MISDETRLLGKSASVIDRVKRFWWRVKARRMFGQSIEVFGAFTVDNPSKVRFGTGCAINAGVHFVGRNGISIGNNVVLSARCMLIDAGLEPRPPGNGGARAYRDGAIEIGDNVWVGAGAIILPGVTIGDGAAVGAGSVVTRNVAAGITVAGNPARPVQA